MKVAVLSESSADEAAIRILVEAILGDPIESPAPFPLRSRGWPSVRDILPSVIKYFHYRTDADGLVVVVDSNGSPLHDEPSCGDDRAKGRSRLAQLSDIVQRVQAQLKPVPTRPPLRVAVGVAAPAIEAWYRCGLDQAASEAAWLREWKAGSQARAKIRALKRAVYGTEIPPLSLETERAAEHARRLTEDLGFLERQFPTGYGSLARAVQSWMSPPEIV